MAYNSQGVWVDENDSVEKRLDGFLSSGSPILKQAGAEATRAMNRRGIQNSSITGGEVFNAKIKNALPIVSQDAAQAANKNISAQGFTQQSQLQKEGYGFQGELQDRDIESRERIANLQETGATTRLGQQLSSAERLAMLQETGLDRRQTQSLAANDALQKWVTGQNITADERKTLIQEAGADSRLAKQLIADEKLANINNLATQTVAGMNINSANRDKVVSMVTQAQAVYADQVNQINNNQNMPADARATALEQAARLRDASLRLVETVYNVNLNWNPIYNAGTT